MGSCVFVCYRSRTRSTRTIIENPSTFNLQHHVPTITCQRDQRGRGHCRGNAVRSAMNRLLTCCCKRTSLVCVTDEAVSSQDAAPPSPLPWSDSILKGHQHPPKEDNYPKGPLCIRVRRRRPRSPRLLFEKLPLGPKKKAHECCRARRGLLLHGERKFAQAAKPEPKLLRRHMTSEAPHRKQTL